MKKITCILNLFLLTFIIPQLLNAQCTPDNTDISLPQAGGPGRWSQSFQATCTGTLDALRIVAANNVSGITVTIYEGDGFAGSNLGFLTNQSISQATGGVPALYTDYSEFDFSGEGILLTSGQTYTFDLSAAEVHYDQSNSPSYSGGQMYFAGDAYSTLDLLFEIDITASNAAPVVTAPLAPTVSEDDTNIALDNSIDITDSDGDNQTVTFTITGGTLTTGTTGITFGGSGNGSSSFTASGTLSAINTALDAATFTPTPGLSGTNAGTIQFVSNDGTDDSNTASVTFDITATSNITIDDPSVTEGNAGTTVLTYTVTLSPSNAGTVIVDYATANGTATAGSDYLAIATTTLTFNSGQTSKTFDVTVNGDAMLEANETILVNLSNITGSNAVITDSQGSGTITNDDTAAVTIANVSGNENDGAITVTATLDNAVQGGFTVDVSTADGTATTADSDYSAVTSQTLTFTGNASENQTFTVTPTGDTKLEANETLIVSQSNLASTTLAVNIADGATVTVDNDDTAAVTIANVSGNENDGAITVTATLDNAVQGGFTVDVSTADGTATTADSDYSAVTSQTLTFTGNASETQTFTVTPTGDTKLEANENLTVSQSNLASTTLAVNIADGATVTVENDDAAAITIANVSGNENDGAITVTATLDNAVQGGFTVDVSTADGTATTADSDYSAVTSQTLTFTGNASETQTFTVTPTGDTKLEANETLIVSQSNLASTTLAVNIADGATVTVDNDDAAAVTIANVSGNENDGAITVTATLDNAVQGGFTVDVSTADGTATTADSDYSAVTSQTLTFTGNASETQTFTVTPTGDTKLEANETLTVSQSNLASTTLAVNIADGATVTVDNDDTAAVTIANVSGNENDGAITVTATLDNAVQGGFTVDVSTADGTATTADSDYSAVTSQTLTFTGNASETQTFTVTPTGDTKLETNETITVSQSNLAATTLGVDITNGAVVTVLNDDFQATVTTSDANSITSNAVDLGGEVTAEGSSSVTARGIVYAITSENASPQIGGANVITDDNGIGSGVFNETISSLAANTQYSYVAYATNTQGTSYGSVKTFSTTTLGIEEEPLKVSVNVYPNPVNKILHINTNNIKLEKVTLYNILGKMIKHIEIENKEIDFSSMTNGIYLLKIVTSEGTLVKRIIKK
ncbi:Calx-beta domain-containing protein [Flavivirga jejuensis]|uniref:Calx-beta domain-containing protein n=1 Tax=Flavivirga jejuensis TaxID=870487 RepID=A0ABT8WNC2_9FLAO|nr:Calx-beta domain-containing protein [Flavivirga jejuensis]MDO5974656.1 Calx-beta domain-containing protein [Flavivirga jejuensis]